MIEDVIDIRTGHPGPTLAVTVLLHGDETCGLAVADAVAAGRIAPGKGRLIVPVMNRPAHTAVGGPRRHLGTDMNRLWCEAGIAADRPEAVRARAVLPLLREADAILDLHSLPHQDVPFLMRSALRPASEGLADALADVVPRTVVAPPPVNRGTALFETALLPPDTAIVVAECGRHGSADADAVALALVVTALRTHGMIDAATPIPAVPPFGREGAGTYEFLEEVRLRHGPFRPAASFGGFHPLRRGETYGYDGTHPMVADEDCHILLTRPAVKPGDEALTLVRRKVGDGRWTGRDTPQDQRSPA